MKKGFTLVEMLGVVIILGLIAAIVYPLVNNIVKDSKNKAYETQKNQLIKASKSYMLDHSAELPDITCNGNTFTGTPKNITITNLSDGGYLDSSEISNPENSEQLMTGYIEVTYSCAYQQYVYTYKES